MKLLIFVNIVDITKTLGYDAVKEISVISPLTKLISHVKLFIHYA